MALKMKNRNIQTWLNLSFQEHANLINVNRYYRSYNFCKMYHLGTYNSQCAFTFNLNIYNFYYLKHKLQQIKYYNISKMFKPIGT